MGLEDQPNFFDTGAMNEPKLEPRDLQSLPAELAATGMRGEVTLDGTEVTISGGGTTSCFSINLETANASLIEDKSYDIDMISDTDHGTRQTSTALQSGEIIHRKRQEALQAALDQLADPVLIEDD